MKKQVRSEILEDMKKYIKGFKPDDYERCYFKTDPSVISFVRDYYSSHLPVDVSAWLRVYPYKSIPYKDELWEQIGFVRDTLCNLFSRLMKNFAIIRQWLFPHTPREK